MPEQIVSFDNEPKLNIDSYFIKPNVAKNANKRFYEKHRINSGQGNQNVPVLNQKYIYMGALKKLYETVRKRQDVERTVNGIEIHYGISLEGNLTYYFQTWYLKNLNEQTNSVRGKVQRDEGIYKYDHSLHKFVKIKEDKVDDIQRYKDWIRIKKKPSPKPDWLKKSAKDPHSILFSFQELFLVYHRNNEGCWIEKKGPADTCTYDGYIEQLAATKWNAPRNEHTLMFKYGINAIVWPEKGTVGNIAHICPPNCDEIEYP